MKEPLRLWMPDDKGEMQVTLLEDEHADQYVYLDDYRELESKLDTARRALERHGYRERCDIPACNCGEQWSHGGHAAERLRELADVLYENGKTPLAVAKELQSRLNEVLADRSAAREHLQRERDRADEAESRLDVLTTAARKVIAELQTRERGSTHWTGCADVHSSCLAIDVLDAALAANATVVETHAPIYTGIDRASGPDRTVYHCKRCGWTGEGEDDAARMSVVKRPPE